MPWRWPSVASCCGSWAFRPAHRHAGNVHLEAIASTASASSVAHEPVAAGHQRGHPAKSIAVLPFDNLSADKNNAYFADGMQDMT